MTIDELQRELLGYKDVVKNAHDSDLSSAWEWPTEGMKVLGVASVICPWNLPVSQGIPLGLIEKHLDVLLGHWDMNWKLTQLDMFLSNNSLPTVFDGTALGDSIIPVFERSIELATHFVRASAVSPEEVVYDKGKSGDRIVNRRVGRYLTHYYGDILPSYVIADIATRYTLEALPSKVLFAASPKRIAMTFLNGPRTCMSYDFETLPIHPSEVYASGDFKVAYLRNKRKTHVNKISARCVVSPARKKYSRIYGDEIRLAHGLEKLGYTKMQRGDFDGLRLRRVDWRGRIIVPYVDNVPRLRVEDEWLVICERGALPANLTDGTAYV